jgi:alanine racemase/LacI family transcriptional regulator
MEDPPTAICVTNYDMTLAAITAAHERGVVLGRDIGFVGFDAVTVCRVITPSLPVVEQPTEEMGRTAGELLLKRLSGMRTDIPNCSA